MPVDFNARFSFDDIEIKKFLGDETRETYSVEPMAPEGFTLDPSEPRGAFDPDTNQTEHSENIVFLSHEIVISAEFVIFYRDGLNEVAKQHGRDLLKNYDPAEHGNDPRAYAASNLGNGLGIDDFELGTRVKLRKYEWWSTPDGPERAVPNEKKIDQRVALFGLLGLPYPGQGDPVPEPPHSDIGTGNDNDDGSGLSLPDWSRGRGNELRYVSRKIIFDDKEPPADPHYVEEVPNADDGSAADSAMDRILRDVVPSSCEPTHKKKFRLLTLAGWIEFKIEWERKRIKVGCAKITIWVPRLRWREAKLVFYVYFKVSKNVIASALKIAEVCAIRSALGSAVLGVVTSNIAAAAAAFKPLFKRCIQQEIKKCLYPGLLMLKETRGWQ